MVIVVTVMARPDKHGFNDIIDVFKANGDRVYSGRCSASPNPFQPQSLEPWWKTYGWVADGIYKAQKIVHPRFGECVLINDGGRVDARYPNPRQNGEMFLREIFVHAANVGGKDPEWRGSAGCFTMHRDEFPKLMSSIDKTLSKMIVKTIAL